MPEPVDAIAHCSACGKAMDVSPLAPFTKVACPHCGAENRVKSDFGPYTLVRRHAIGGMSMVFVAHDNTLDREVALKILSEEYSADERRISAFEEEARITASFSHPHVVRVLRTGRAFGRFYIAMELVPGGHFEHQIRERGAIPEGEMLLLAIEVAQGLKAAHTAGLIHRDVKPGNILLDAEGHAKLVDFGLALVTQGGKAKATEIWATPYYVPPETIEGLVEDFRSDIYAFGATLYHALAGQPPCGEESMATEILREAKRNVVPLCRVAPGVSADTCTIVDRAMAFDPANRYDSYDTLISDLETALKRFKAGAMTAGDVAKNATRAEARRKRANRLLATAVAVPVLVTLIGGVWWVGRRDPQPPVPGPATAASFEVMPDITATTDVAAIYRKAREAVAKGNPTEALRLFQSLSEDAAVQEPSRSWAGVEAVAAAYLQGNSSAARSLAHACTDHAASLPENSPRLAEPLPATLRRVQAMPAIRPDTIPSNSQQAARIVSSLLAGLKNWEQGMIRDAVPFFTEVAAVKLDTENRDLKVYQQVAADYLKDAALLDSPLFAKLPASAPDCAAAVKELDGLLGTLKSQGRARFNIRAWQLDLTRHRRLLEHAADEPAPPRIASSGPQFEPGGAVERFLTLATGFRFLEAADLLKSLDADPPGASRATLITLAESAAIFLADLESDLARTPVSTELPLKSGELAIDIAAMNGKLVTTDATGKSSPRTWQEFSPDALINLHRILVKFPRSELERLRRHQCAISFDWLAGNRDRSLSAAASLCQSSPSFKQRWDSISPGLPGK